MQYTTANRDQEGRTKTLSLEEIVTRLKRLESIVIDPRK